MTPWSRWFAGQPASSALPVPSGARA